MKTFTINDREFVLATPTHGQRIKLFEKLKEFNFDYEAFSTLSLKLSQKQPLTDEQNKQFSQSLEIMNFTELPAEIAALWLVEKNTRFSKTYESNREMIMDWFQDADVTLEISLNNFLSAMQPKPTTNQGK